MRKDEIKDRRTGRRNRWRDMIKKSQKQVRLYTEEYMIRIYSMRKMEKTRRKKENKN